MAYRMSQYSNHSRTNTMQQPVSSQVSTTTLLNALHSSFSSGQPYQMQLESSTSLVVNTWRTASTVGPDGRYGGTVSRDLARRAWEHARRRAEDACILLGSLHPSAPCLFPAVVSALPLSVPGAFYTAVDALRPFLHCATPFNPSLPRYTALAGTFTLTLTGDLTAAELSLSNSGIDTQNGLLNVPSEPGYRAFDVFYYLLTSRSEQEREYLGLKPPQQYTLLRRSDTYQPPSYLPTADDAAAAEDLREALKAIGIKGRKLNSLLCVVASILRLGDALGFLVDGEELEATCEEVAGLLELDTDVLLKKCATDEREVLIAALYEALVDWVISQANDAIRSEIRAGRALNGSDDGFATPPSSQDDSDNVSITVIDVPGQILGKAASLKTVFDDSTGINAEMKEDGVPLVPAGSSVLREMRDAVNACEADLGTTGPPSRERDHALDRRQGVLEKVGSETEEESFLRQILYPVAGQGITLGKTGRFSLTNVLGSSRVWFHLCLHPSDDPPASMLNHPPPTVPWSAGSVSGQIRGWRLAEWANFRTRQLDFTADFDVEEFAERYGALGCRDGKDGVEGWVMERGWSNGEVVVGHERIWIREPAYWEAESMLDMKGENLVAADALGGAALVDPMESTYSLNNPAGGFDGYFDNGSKDNLLRIASRPAMSQIGTRSLAPTHVQTLRSASGGDYGLGFKGDDKRNYMSYDGEVDPELTAGKDVIVQKTSRGRRMWVAFVWLMTWWIPSPLLKHIGRMRRPDVRMAWREKLTLIMLIALINCTIVFYIVEFGRLLCPNYDKAWNTKEVGENQGTTDFYVAFRGGVYDLTHFYKLQHSDSDIDVTSTIMLPFAGTDVTEYIVPPLILACPQLVTDKTVTLQSNTTLTYPDYVHTSGYLQTDTSSKLSEDDWYNTIFLPKMATFYKGQYVFTRSDVKSQGQDEDRMWVIIDHAIYDFTDYFYTLALEDDISSYDFMPSAVTTLVQSNPGLDITDDFNALTNTTARDDALACMKDTMLIGHTDFRTSARCQVNNYILLSFTIVLCVVIATKFLAALQLGSKKRPAQQDKFVICQVPAYTEGEDSLRKGLDSLTALNYDNKRKLICVICDGMIVGGGNDRPTPKIVLDILGVDPKIDPPALPFKSVGVGNEQLNYGKVYSGLYEYEGNVVPYLVVVKVGKESEQSKSKPGNRGKRDSQILLMSFLNRVHHRSPMNPLELEMFHQINNIIGVDPELYEYLFMVDADTKVKEDSLNRLVAACANDAKIAGICGETSLENEERSWWTMIQVYEYYISHHLAKAFESLFGSVTCLPGCFCMYRLRTADKGRPLIISDTIVSEYSDNNIDTLHKKNLLSLGEDRYLTTLMCKHFPTMSYKFVADAYALTEAPAQWSVLLSQRRRWINSTIHNLAELVWIDMCGFCCFSMRFVVFIDLCGTIILPATCAYLVYLIYRVASHSGQFPLISIIMIGVVYGLQALIFLIKRQWQHIGWMIIYILAYPVWSFVLPIYSFWKQDDFSWGNTRVVIGEKGDKQLVAVDQERFDPRNIPLQRWDDYALTNGLPGRRGLAAEKEPGMYDPASYEMDDMHSMYSSVRPASTVLTGFPGAAPHHQQHHSSVFRPPPPMQSPSPFQAMQHPRHSTMSHLSRYTDNPTPRLEQQQQRLMSMGGGGGSPFRPGSTPLPQQHANASSLSVFTTHGPTHDAISLAVRECLSEVDLDTVTKKQLKALAEQKLQCQLVGDKRVFLDAEIDVQLAAL